MSNFMNSISQNIQRYPKIFSILTLGPMFLFSIVTFFVLRTRTNSVGQYTMCFFHFVVFTLFMIYFEYKMSLCIKSIYYLCLSLHIIFIILLFIMIVYTFFFGISFVEYLKQYNMIDESVAFEYYFRKKIGFGIAIIIIFILQVRDLFAI